MDRNKQVLIIGCGNIGALYDYRKEGIKTHAKAFSLMEGYDVSVFDVNKNLSQEIGSYYNYKVLDSTEDILKGQFDIVIIATPTQTHFNLLRQMLQLEVPVIICEKPIADTVQALEQLYVLKSNSRSKVLVNYFRRFQPAYLKLRDWISGTAESPTNIQLTYQRGFLNNATHGLDLIHFLLGNFELNALHIAYYEFDEFEKDPTLTLTGKYGDIPITIQGLQHVHHSFF